MLVLICATGLASETRIANGLAPEVPGLSAQDISYQLEQKIPDLPQPFINISPENRHDGLEVGTLGVDGGQRDRVLRFAHEIADRSENPKIGQIDSLLICYQGKLLFESYYRRGRINYPHYQMSITKSYTTLAIGRAIALGYLSMADLDKPIISFLKGLDRTSLVKGAHAITLDQVMQMTSGIRLSDQKTQLLRQTPQLLHGQGHVQAFLENSSAIPAPPRAFKYQSSDPSITMQVLESAVPGTADDFIRTQLLLPLGISNYHWQTDVSGLPKAAAGSSFCSRDMVKIGLLVLSHGRWNGNQLLPEAFLDRATSPLQKTGSNTSYGYFWWTENFEVAGRLYQSKQGRGAGGQFLFLFPDLDLIAVVTSHNKGMGTMLRKIPQMLLPAFDKP